MLSIRLRRRRDPDAISVLVNGMQRMTLRKMAGSPGRLATELVTVQEAFTGRTGVSIRTLGLAAPDGSLWYAVSTASIPRSLRRCPRLFGVAEYG